ncbi:MAG: alpha-amylase/4-alpha-glucanotransferase domain-containing protein [Spirochaetota bacterium]
MSCNFIFCLHNHQPVGNFDHIFKWAFDDCYNKIIEIFKEYPDFRFSVHHSGPLLEWMKSNAPEYIETLREMSHTGQVEIIGGGFYEPIFSIINENDIKGQIALMQNFCKKEFGKYPKGFWTAERVWDPDIPNLVSGFNLDYTILDDIHFRYAGIGEEELYGYFLTERLDKKLKIFPIDRFLRYAIPFRQPAETINYFKEKTDKLGHAAFVYGDDGEKFGLWPDTYKWVYEERWLRNFIESVLKESWIKTTHPSEYIKSNAPIGRVYITQGSYFELSEWALPAKAAEKLIKINNEIKGWNRENDFYPYLKGGVWNNFLNKYPESNAINKRTILLSKEISACEEKTGLKFKNEKTELYKSECNCAYWHGLFGGIYLNHLRHALYEHILKAENMFMKKCKKEDISIVEDDFWNEGHNQILIRNKNQSVIILPYSGGAVSEFGIYNKAFNILNVIPRRQEAYHEVLREYNEENNNNNNGAKIASIHDRIKVKEKNLKQYLVFDKSRRYSFKEILFNHIPLPEDIMFGRENYYDCSLLEYGCKIQRKRDNAGISLSGSIIFNDENISIKKNFSVSNKAAGLRADYAISGIKKSLFGVELNINLLGSHDEDRGFDIPGVPKENAYMDNPGITNDITGFSIYDNYNKFRIEIASSVKAALVRYPIFSVSQSDSGFEKNYQGSSLLLIYDFTGTAAEVNIFSIDLSIRQ